MAPTRKIAMVGREWLQLYTRLLAGGMQYANAHPSENVVVRPFARAALAKLAARIERWGADGIYGMFRDKELKALKAALKHPIPIVNNGVSPTSPGVVHVLAEPHAFAELGVEHLRHLGLKYFGMLLMDAPPEPNDPLLSRFKQLTEPHTSVLVLPRNEAQDLSPERHKTNPKVRAPLRTWLLEMPKPCGVLCPCVSDAKFLAECCAQLGLQVPGELAIIGTDEADVCLSCKPTLTSITANVERLGAESVRVLLGILNGKTSPMREIRIKGAHLVVRESTGQQRPMICDVAGALEYIKANATRGLSAAQLMRQTQRCSHPTFYQSFYRATGMTPAQAIRERQMEEVRRLLATTQLPVAAVSVMSGFSRASAMARFFRKVEGMTPMEYRKRESKE
jgi:LacI family transcriptional regulator